VVIVACVGLGDREAELAFDPGQDGVRPPQRGFRSDPFAPLVQALEEFDPVSQTAAKAAIFTSRVVAPRRAGCSACL
jgi:hypothetical protein